jgi:hypothetical protein
VIAAVSLIFGFATGCADEARDAGIPDVAAIADTAPPATERPRQPEGIPLLPETVLIEGMPEEMPVQSVESPVGFEPGFSTVAPADMLVSFDDTVAEVRGISFEADFAGIHRPEVRLEVLFLPDRTDAEDARLQVEVLADSLGAETGDRGELLWASSVYDLGDDVFGFLALGQHNGRWFYVLSRYPPEFGDGMAPRVALILRRWTWSDDGTTLEPEN